MEYLLLGLACVVILILLFAIFAYNYRRNNKSQKLQKVTAEKTDVKCPVCGSFLLKGENLISKVYRPMDVPDQFMTISGCPHCYPDCEPYVKRVCPVCHKTLGSGDVLTARLFNRSAGKKHVHVAGCSHCHKMN